MTKKKMTAGLIAATLTLGSVSANAEPSQKSEVYGDWTVRCIEREGLPPCDMVQFATQRDTGEQVMQFSIAHAGKPNSYGFQIRTPLGVRLIAGAAIRIDDQPALSEFKFSRCEAEGCFIEKVMEPGELKPFRAGGSGMLVIIGRDAEPMALPLSFKGFDEALGVMTARNRKWAGNS